MVRAGNFTDSDRPNDSHVAFSTDGGGELVPGPEPGGINSGGTVAAAADGSRFVWAPGDAGQPVVFSVGFGNSWTQSTGVPANAIVESDRVNPQKFYAYTGGRFYVSTNGGAAFTQTAATGLPASDQPCTSRRCPAAEGDIWLAGGDTAAGCGTRPTRAPASPRLSTVTDGGQHRLRQGGARPDVPGAVPGRHGRRRSRACTAPTTPAPDWVRINDDAHQYGNTGEAITGDPRIYGRVYLGTNGRGILYADRTGAPPADLVPPSAAVLAVAVALVVAPVVASSRRVRRRSARPPRPTPTTGGTGACTATYSVTNSWGGGFQGSVVVTNTGTTATTAGR